MYVHIGEFESSLHGMDCFDGSMERCALLHSVFYFIVRGILKLEL